MARRKPKTRPNARAVSSGRGSAAADAVPDDMPALRVRVAAEVFGTFLLVLGTIGTALFSVGAADAGVGYLGVALAIGFTIVAGGYAVGHLSGGHFNPAVTLGLAVAHRIEWRAVPAYIGAQVVGGLIGSTVLVAIAAGGPDGALAKLQANGFASNGFDGRSPGGFGLLSVAVTEFVLTAVFVLVILGITAKPEVSPQAPLAIGLTLALIHLASIPIDNTSVNPARSIATAVYGGVVPLGQLWLFVVVPIAGGLVAGAIHRPLFGGRRS